VTSRTSQTGGSPTLNIGIIGLGGGASDMVPAFVNHPNVNVMAAADIDQGQLDKFTQEFPGSNTYHDAVDLCANPNVHLVYIATPNRFHTPHVLAALDRKKHVLVEKPMTLELEEALALAEAADKAGVHLAVNVKHSFEPRVQRVRQMVKTGELGRLLMMNYWYYADWLYRPRTTEELTAELGGGVTWRQGPHQLDILRTIGGGRVRSLKAMSGIWDKGRPVVAAHSVFLDFEDGAAATAVYDGYDHFNSREFTFGVEGNPPDPKNHAQARRGQAKFATKADEDAQKAAGRYSGAPAQGAAPGQREDPGRSSAWVLGGPLIVSFEHGDVRLTTNGLEVYGDEERWSIDVPVEQDGRHRIVQNLYDAAVHDKRPVNDGRWGVATLEVLLAIKQSGEERKEVFLSHQVEIDD